MLDYSDETIIDGVLAEFSQLARIPRKSGHEKAVSDYLVKAFSDIGCEVHQDEVNNVIADLPATDGMESAPKIILQGHMDMVCVADHGVSYDPLKDPIKLVRDEKFLSADGTSLGADDGIGIAEALYIMKHLKSHGPLRAVITVDEEQGMTGAVNLDSKYLLDAQYLINCDSENYDELTVGSAGSVNINFNRQLTFSAPQGDTAYKIHLKGLAGGHSGMEINKGRGNAIRIMAMVLNALDEAGISYELAYFTGGKARNSIPAVADVIISTMAEAEVIQEIIDTEKESCMDKYGDVEDGIELVLSEVNMPERVMSEEDRDSIIRIIISLHSGVYAMSQVVPGLVETSANLGMVKMDDDVITMAYLPRSSIDAKISEFVLQADILAQMAGFTAVISNQTPAWKENRNSKLAKVMLEVFKEQNGMPMKVETIHAGLECGYHVMKNPQLDVVSIGVSTFDIHSPKERLELATIPPQVKLIVETMKRLTT
ncbi:beta-Ala-His dipeptidase [uncultured Anaerovibrio sp.]|uniref:beta-Ala-His dipeptidase n=1 Tax=uncultured Anaerovibrio sp. TaxID=361586 RepID=UPI00261AEF51|nr:beta-Ala-His dipeptidase [uncultured Anaerovibrio sp.]